MFADVSNPGPFSLSISKGAIMNGGSVGALVGLLGLAVLSRFALLKLADCGRMVPGVSAATYPEVGEAAFGKAGRVAAWFGMLAMTLGVRSS